MDEKLALLQKALTEYMGMAPIYEQYSEWEHGFLWQTAKKQKMIFHLLVYCRKGEELFIAGRTDMNGDLYDDCQLIAKLINQGTLTFKDWTADVENRLGKVTVIVTNCGHLEGSLQKIEDRYYINTNNAYLTFSVEQVSSVSDNNIILK